MKDRRTYPRPAIKPDGKPHKCQICSTKHRYGTPCPMHIDYGDYEITIKPK